MSTATAAARREHRVTVRSLAQRKNRGEPITMLTAYDFTFARIFDEAGIDLLLVGDSLANVIQGHDTTLPVTLDEVLYHTRLVRRGVKRALVVGDMPFGSYQVGPEDAVRSAIRFVKEAGAHAVKLEGGALVAESIERIVRAQVPVMGHVGLTPQSVNAMGGYRVQGRGEAAERVRRDALAVQEAGAFAVVMEMVPGDVAAEISPELTIPTIGIGAGAGCDGQVLVWQDAFGLRTGRMARFVKQYADVHSVLLEGARAYAADVKGGTFPASEHTF